MVLQECKVCGERKYLEGTGTCLSERCSPSRSDARRVAAMAGEPAPTFDEPVREKVVQLVEGEACPTCGQSVAKSGKTRQKEYRERKKS